MADINRDLVVVTDSGKIYLIPSKMYENPELKLELPEEQTGVVRNLIKFGATFGYMQQTGPGVGSACYLVNLRSLRTNVPEFPAPVPADPGPGDNE
jgi:hypothetical protein